MPPSTDSAQLWNRRDLWIAAALLVAATMGGMAVTRAFVANGNAPAFYQPQFGPAVLAACGHGFLNPSDSVEAPELKTFLLQRAQSFDCGTLPHTIATTQLNTFQLESPYLLRLSGWIWMLFGVSWPILAWVGAIFMGIFTAAVYLFFRAALGSILAVFLTALWVTSPLHLSQVPHLRDYSKAPFFAVMLCAVMWILRSATTRVITVAAMAAVGGFLGLGFGFRTDVAIYLPMVVVALFFRAPWSRREVATTCMASVAAVVMFLIVAAPVFGNYQRSNNVAHWALLGLSDPSRDWLQLREAPYSFAAFYNDSYVAMVMAGFAERQTELDAPLLLGTPAYSTWSDDYYHRLATTFPGDVLSRAWAAVLAVYELPFDQVNVVRPRWIDQGWNWMFAWRVSVLELLHVVPPLAVVMALAVAVSVASPRLSPLLLLFAFIVPGMTSFQYHDRHVFHLEIIALAAYAWLLSGGARLAIDRTWMRVDRIRPAITRAAAIVAILTFIAVTPVVAARSYQQRAVTRLFESYTSADLASLPLESVATGGENLVLVPTPLPPSANRPRFVDTNVLSIAVGGPTCDTDVVSLRFVYHAEPPYLNFSRSAAVPVPQSPADTTTLVLPVYSLGERSSSDALRFVGVELPVEQQPCLQSIARFQEPWRFPLLLESLLLPDWRARPKYEMLRRVETSAAEWRTEYYSVPAALQTGRRWMARLEKITEAPTFRSPQVRQLDAEGIEVRGRAATNAAYLVSWPYAPRARGSAFLAEGEVIDGGVTIGIEQNDQWVHQINVFRPGRFRAVIRVDSDGRYGAVLANHQLRGLYNRTTITRYGWLPPQP
jgi:hypothetical protein